MWSSDGRLSDKSFCVVRSANSSVSLFLTRQISISAGQVSVNERANAVRFFARYANDVPNFRAHLLEPLAIPLLIERLKSHDDEAAFLCTILSNVSNFSWCIHLLAESDACPHLVKELMYVFHSFRRHW